MTLSQDKVVAGLYRLGKLLHYSRESAIYETEYGDDNKPAVIRLRRGDTPEADLWLKRWREALELPHPNLIAVYGAGKSVVDDHPVIYVLMERADQSLDDVLKDRALSEQEVAEMLEPALSALTYLHGSDFSHTNLKPSQILAVGDRLKLSSDSVQSVGDGGRPSEDVWALGTVIVQALTQRVPEIDEEEGPYILRDASEPVTDAVRHCLDPDVDRRWTVDQIATRLNLKTAVAAPLTIQVATQPGAPSEVPKVEPDPAPVPKPFEESAPASNQKWIYAAVAAALVILAVLGLGKESQRPVSNPIELPVPAAVAAAVPTEEAHAPVPRPSSQLATQTAKQTPTSSAGNRRAEGWVVIVASYGSRGAAEKRAKNIAKRWPKFQLDTFQPASDKSHHLVILGKNLSEDEAEVLRKRAVSAGLARDAYIKRLL